MRWLAKLIFALVILSGTVLGQSFTQVSGTAKDAQGNLYVNCSYSVHFVGQSTEPGPYLFQGSVFQQNYAGARCDGFGNFSIRLPSNQAIQPRPSSWSFNFCDTSGHFCNPMGSAIIPIAGSEQNISAELTPVLPILSGGGGWNPPSNIQGGTIFGNNTVGTGTPTFFIPGGDVSFSSGNFWVNSLHFGPTNLFLTNQGLTTGSCLTVSGSNIIGGPCGGGPGGGGTVTSFSAGSLTPLFTTSVANATSTPVLSFSLSAAPANTMLGNSGGTAAAPSWIPIPAPGGGGGVSTGTINSLAKYNTTTTVASSAASDDSTTLTYTGTGGIAAPQFTTTGTGGFLVTSAMAALPATPGANQNGWVSGPDGWYFSNANGAWTKIGAGGAGGNATGLQFASGSPISLGAPPTSSQCLTYNGTSIVGGACGGAGGVTSFGPSGAPRTGVVIPATGDYTVAQVTGAAPISSPTFTTAAHAPTPAPTSNDTSVATTAWVKANAGGGTPVPIAHSAQAAICSTPNTATSTSFSSLNILDGDTVMVAVFGGGNTNNYTVSSVVDGPSATNTYQQRAYYTLTGGGQGFSAIWSTAPGAAHAATSMTVTISASGRHTVCVAAYTGVASFGTTPYQDGSTVNATTATASAAVEAGGFLFSAFSIMMNSQTFTPTAPATVLQQFAAAAIPNNAGALCEVTSATAATVNCALSWTTTGPRAVTGVVMNPSTTPTSIFAPINSPAFTGTPTAPSPPAQDNSQRLATTAWVTAHAAGGGSPLAIAHGAQAPICQVQNSATALTETINVTINDNDTVLISIVTNPSSNTVSSVVDSGGTIYSLVNSRAQTALYSLYASAASGAHASNSVTVTNTGNARFAVCVATYVNVNQIGANLVSFSNTAANPASVVLNAQDNNNYMFAMLAVPQNYTATISPGTPLQQGQATITPGVSLAICESSAITSGNAMNCTATFSTAAAWVAIGVELRSGAVSAGASPWPKVVAYRRANFTVTTSNTTDVAWFSCPIAQCPVNGYYRIAWDFLAIPAGCTGGTLQINVDYRDEAEPLADYHTGMMQNAASMGPGRNHVFGYRHMTVAAPLTNGNGISFTTSSVGCSTGEATAQVVVTVERLQ